MTTLSVRREVGEFKKRYKWMALVAIAAFSILFFRLIYLQLITHDRWVAEAQDNITKRVPLPATRGVIRDTKGREIATNRPAFDVYVTPQLLKTETIERITWLMGFDQRQTESLKTTVEQIPESRRSHLTLLFSDITREQVAALETFRRELPGLQVISKPVRAYPYKSLGAHVIGFLNQVNADDLKQLSKLGYRSGHSIGRAGLEKTWENYLRGRDGELKVVVDVRGRELQSAGPKASRRNPVPGRDLELTLDMTAMRSAERAFARNSSGAVVLLEVRTGRIRVLYSKPSYDLNEMAGRLSAERSKQIESDPYRPLIDKTTAESYFPGSVYKPFSAIAALEDHLLDPATTIYDCPGYYELGGRRFRCSEVHKKVDLRKAIVRSCNVFFFHLAEQVGLDRLARIAKEFGLGTKTGVGINEATGFIPTRDWYMKRYNNRFRLGFTLNETIGQGNTRVTLVQLATAYAAIANGGTLYAPQLVKAITAPNGDTIERFEPRVRRRIAVDRKNLAYLIDALFGVVNDSGGTAYEARIEGSVPVAGKTGTAQVAVRNPAASEDDPKQAWFYNRSHAWFVGFAPAQEPELVAAVLVEHGGPGGKNAAPIAIQILNDALKKPSQE